MKKKLLLKLSYILFLMFYVGLLIYGKAYYFAPTAIKVRSALHPILRQSGSTGHLLGILGSLFMVLLLLYSLRKRLKFMRNWGSLDTWLDVHIFLGLAGPALVLLHTAFKFSGIVAISFWSMVLVVLSGVIGKYIYELIPHSLSGLELSRIELEAEEIALTFEMRKLLPHNHPCWKVLSGLEQKEGKGSILKSLFLFVEYFKVKSLVSRSLRRVEGMDKKKRKELVALVVKRQMLMRRAHMLQYSMKIIHYWHLLHKPFVIIMFLILVIHVYVSVKLGYIWAF